MPVIGSYFGREAGTAMGIGATPATQAGARRSLNLHLFQRPLVGSEAIMDLSPYVTNWKDETRAIGGHLTGSFSLSDGQGPDRGQGPTLTRDQLAMFFESYLGCMIRRVAFGMTAWEGLIYEMRLSIDGVEYTRSLTRELWHNRMRVIYATAQNARVALDWLENADSIAQFGTMEYILTLGNMKSPAAYAIQNRHLLEFAWPRTRMSNEALAVSSTSRGTGKGVTLEVACAGFWATLNWRYQEADIQDSASDLISTLVGASEFVTAGRVETNTLSTLVESAPTAQRLGDLIEQIISQGDANGNRWQGGVYAGRKLRYEAAPTTAAYQWHNGMLQTSGGGEVAPELVLPGALIRNTSRLAAWRPVGTTSAADDPQLAYIEAVEFDQQEGLKLNLSQRDPQTLTQDPSQLTTLVQLWIGKAEGPRVGLWEYQDDAGDPSYVFEAAGPDNVPFISAGAVENGDADSGWVNIGYETFPRIHFEQRSRARKVPMVDVELLNALATNYGTAAATDGQVPVARSGVVGWETPGPVAGADHGALTGLADDDHAQYLLATGARTGASAGKQTFTTGVAIPNGGELTWQGVKGTLNASGLTWNDLAAGDSQAFLGTWSTGVPLLSLISTAAPPGDAPPYAAEIYSQTSGLLLSATEYALVATVGVIKSEIATGTAPFTVASTTKVTNLNADLLDGIEASGFVPAPAVPERGDVLYYNGSGWVALNHGTADQMLLSGGHGANPSWGAAVAYNDEPLFYEDDMVFL